MIYHILDHRFGYSVNPCLIDLMSFNIFIEISVAATLYLNQVFCIEGTSYTIDSGVNRSALPIL